MLLKNIMPFSQIGLDELAVIRLDPSFTDEIARDIGAGYPFSESIVTICQHLITSGNYYNALKILSAAIKRKEIDDAYWKGRVNKLIGDIYFIWGNLNLARKYYKLASDCFKGFPYAFARIQLDLGNIALEAGEWASMQRHYSIAEDAIADEDDRGTLADIELNRGISLSMRGRFSEAFECFQRALDISAALEDSARIAACHLNISIAQMDSGYLEPAMESIKTALGYAKEAGDLNLETLIYVNRAKLSLILKDYMVAQFYSEKAREFVGKINNKMAEAELERIQALLEIVEGRLDEAVARLDRSIALAKESCNISIHLESSVELARLLFKLGQIPRAKETLLEAKNLAQKKHLDHISETINRLEKTT